MFIIRCLACLAVLAASAFAADQPDAPNPAPAIPNIILITMDTTRADRMGFLGSKRGLTPNLDKLAQQSAVFTRAYSQAPLTPTSHATILTGTYPQYHQVLTFPIPLGRDIPFLPEILKNHGYATAAVVGSLALDPNWGVPGFDRGFDSYDAHFNQADYTPENRESTTERRAGVVVQHALDWLDGHQKSPFFLWIHVFDPHDPYEPPEPYKTKYAKALYDGEIAYTDFALGNFFNQLKSRGLYDGAIIAMTADHGESLGAHGEDQHGIFLYDETIHVPLLIKLPQGATAGKRVDDRVELADIMPTILGALGIDVPEKVQGQSLLGFLKPGTIAGDAAAAAWHDRGAYSQADYAHVSYGWSALQSLRTGKYLFVEAPRRELYDDVADPKAAHNLAPASPAVADTLSTRLKDFQQKTTNTGETPKAVLDAATIKKLAALGYQAARGEALVAPASEEGADPKDKIAVANELLRVNRLLKDFRCQKAVPELKKAVAKFPTISTLHFFLGGCYMESKDYAKAVPELRQTVKLDPGFTHAELNLGRAELEIKDYEAAAVAFEHVAKSSPHLMDAHVFLEVVYARLNRVQDEIAQCRFVLNAEPEHYGSNLNLGRFLAQSGDLEAAIPSLQKAASIRPSVPVPHIYLADVYEKLGRNDDAARERAEAERLGAVSRDSLIPPNSAPDTTDKH